MDCQGVLSEDDAGTSVPETKCYFLAVRVY